MTDTRTPDHPTDEDFRATGYTGHARNFPLSDRAFRWLCGFNGIPPEAAPETWKYAPNAAMRLKLEALSNYRMPDTADDVPLDGWCEDEEDDVDFAPDNPDSTEEE